MEYLMTYKWAILVVGVVLVVLFGGLYELMTNTVNCSCTCALVLLFSVTVVFTYVML